MSKRIIIKEVLMTNKCICFQCSLNDECYTEDEKVDPLSKKMIGEILDYQNRIFQGREEKIIVTCPICDGTGFEGHDRSVPPCPYICYLCDGHGKVEIKSLDSMDKNNVCKKSE